MQGARIRLAVTWLITTLILIALFWKIRPTEVVRALRGIDVGLLLAALVLSTVNHALVAAERYRRIIQALGCRISLGEAILIRMGGAPIKGLLPVKSGELAKVLYLKRRHSFPYHSGILATALGYLISLLSFSLFILAGWVLAMDGPPNRFFFGLALIIGLPLVILVLARAPLGRAFSRFLRRTQSDTLSRIPEALSGQLEGLKREGVRISFYSILLEGCKVINAFIIFKALGMEVPFSVALFRIPLTIMAANLPITIGGLGTRETSTLILFSDYAPESILVAASLSTSMVNLFFPMMIGLLFTKRFLGRLLLGGEETPARDFQA